MSLPFKILVILLAVAFIGYGQHRHAQGVKETTAIFEATIALQKIKTDSTLAAETAKTRIAEQALQTATDQQEMKDADNQKIVLDMASKLRRAAGAAVRLRDPNAAPGCGGGGGNTTGPTATAVGDRTADATETGGLFSEGATELLQRLTSESDEINSAYISCRADAYTLRAGR